MSHLPLRQIPAFSIAFLRYMHYIYHMQLMQRLKTHSYRAWLIRLCCMIAFASASHTFAQGTVTASPVFKDIEVLADQTNDGLKGVALRFKLHFPEPISPIVAASYAIECVVTDEFGYPIRATAGAVGYANRNGDCRDSVSLQASMAEGNPNDHTMFVPYVAMGIDPGPNRIQLQLRLWDQVRRQVLVQSAPLDLRFEKPTMQLYRMQVERIESYNTDADGETWDYKFLNARDIYPELIWSLRRGNRNVFESPKQKNDTIYKGAPADISPWIWLSQGDRIHYYVHDFDLLGFSDLVGSLVIDVWQQGFRSGKASELRFERVREALVTQEAIVAPKVAVTGYEIIEQDQIAGVTGTRVKLHYAIQNSLPGARYFLGLKLQDTLAAMVPTRLQVIGSGAVPAGNGVVELLAQQSSLELFIPHFGWAAPMVGNFRLLLEAGMLLDGQPIVLTRLHRQYIAAATPVADMGYGQWKVGVEDQAGRGGLRMSMDYALPAGYLLDAASSKIKLVPRFVASWGEIDNAFLEVVDASASTWNGDALPLDAQHAQGTLDLFLPFDKCPPGGGAMNFEATYHTVMQLDGQETSLGTVKKVAQVEMPPLRELQLGLREASVARRLWILSPPTMFWELRCGKQLLLRSKVVAAQRNARWPDDAIHKWVVAPSDRIELRVYHQGTQGEADRLLEMWTGQLSELPGKEKGNVRLPTTSLKKMLLHLEYVENEKRN
jgi:hypothetical protein